MADISKITLPNNNEYDLKDATARSSLTNKQDKITAEGILVGDGTGGITGIDSSAAGTISIDNTPTENSSNLVTSGGVYTALSNVDALPDQTGHSGEFLTTNGTIASWADIPEEIFLVEYNVTTFDEIKAAYDAGKYIFLKYLTLKEAHDVDVQWSLCPLTQYYYQELTSPNYKGEAYFLIPMNNGPPTPSLSYKYAWITINTAQQTGGWEVSSSSFSFAKSTHTHGNITNDGDITATAPTIANGDQIIINDNSASKITNGPTFDGSTTNKYLSPKGTWENIPTVPSPADATPLMDNATAAVGTSTDYAREDHVHPSDTSRQAKITASGILKGDGNGNISAATAGTDYQSPITTEEVTEITVDTTVTASSNNLITSGAVATAISNIDALPSQTGNNGKFLTTNGTAASWAAVGDASTMLNRSTAVNVADTNYSTVMARGIYAGDSDLSAGVSLLDSGVIYLYYE